MGRRTVLLIVAALIAALGSGLVILYVRGVDARADAKYDAVEVLTAVKMIEPGETIASAKAEDGRWFVQSYGDLAPVAQAHLTRPSMAELTGPDGRGVRLHLLGDAPMSAITALGPDPTAEAPRKPSDEPGRAALMLRRTSTDGGTLRSMFVTVFEPVGGGPPLLLSLIHI